MNIQAIDPFTQAVIEIKFRCLDIAVRQSNGVLVLDFAKQLYEWVATMPEDQEETGNADA